jgi:hypothetical protein
MNSLNWRLDRRTDLLVALFFGGLSLLFFARVLFVPAGQALGGHDMVGNYYIYWTHVRESILSGRLPFWEPRLFGGFPFMAQPQQNTFYPPNWINLVLPVRAGVTLHMIFHVWLAGFGMFAYVRYLGGRLLPSILAGIGFAFGGLLAGRLWAGHLPVYAVFIWTPVMLLALAWAVERRRPAAAIIAGLPFGLAILAGHIPSFLYVGLIWAGFVIYLFLTAGGDRWLVIRQAFIAAVIGLTLAAVQLAPFLQFSLSSERLAVADYEFATDYSLPPAHLITLLIPEFFGEPMRVGYWSVPTFEELTYYAGIMAVLGILLALRRPTRLAWFYIFLIVMGLWLALGRYGILYELAYRYFPPFRLVRAPGRAAFFYLFAGSALLGHILSERRSRPLPERIQSLRIYWPATVAVFGLALFSGLAATGAVFMAIHPTDTSGRLWHQIGGYSLALIVVGIGGALIWAYIFADKEQNAPHRYYRRLVAIGLIILVIADMWWFSFKMVRPESTAPLALWSDGKAIVGDPEGRVLPWGLPLFSQNGAMQVDWPSVFGYDSLEPAAHIALASSVPDPRSSAYDILGASHVLAGGPLDSYLDGDRPLTLLGQEGSAWVYNRARTLPIARLVYQFEVIPNSSEAIARVHAIDFNPASTVILDETPPCDPAESSLSTGTAEIEAHDDTYWRINTSSDSSGLLVLAENAYPGWQATIDGQPAQTLTAYTAIRAVCVPAGDHIVEWTYNPSIYFAGGTITIVSLLITLFAISRLRRHSFLDG